MASIKNLKKDINYVLSSVIDDCNDWQLQQNDPKKADKAEKIIDETITVFDELIDKIYAKNVENKKVHFNGIKAELETKRKALLAKIEKL